jgi:hypothetical protein
MRASIIDILKQWLVSAGRSPGCEVHVGEGEELRHLFSSWAECAPGTSGLQLGIRVIDCSRGLDGKVAESSRSKEVTEAGKGP